jgi:DNA-binding NarL/FixJ family response regulator
MDKKVIRKRPIFFKERSFRKYRRKVIPQLSLGKTTLTTFEAFQVLVNVVRNLAVQEKCSVEQVLNDLVQMTKTRHEMSQIFREHRQRLTPREQEVAGLVCQRLTNKQIAIQLTISPDTVKTHVHKLLVKLNLHRKNELMAAFNEKDFISGKRQD